MIAARHEYAIVSSQNVVYLAIATVAVAMLHQDPDSHSLQAAQSPSALTCALYFLVHTAMG